MRSALLAVGLVIGAAASARAAVPLRPQIDVTG